MHLDGDFFLPQASGSIGGSASIGIGRCIHSRPGVACAAMAYIFVAFVGIAYIAMAFVAM